MAVALAAASWEVSAQMYRPPEPFSMWDTWLFPDGDEYHLFFLQSEPGLQWNAIGRAVSADLVHWRPLPAIPTKGAPGEWDFAPTLTGTTVKIGDRYACFYGSSTHGQKIGVMFSDDLVHWTKHPGNPILGIQPPHYDGADWRDLCTFYDPEEKLWHGCVCAQTGGDAAIAHLTSPDLIRWNYLPAAFSSPDFVDMEVPDYFELNGRHYLLFSSGRTRKDTGGRTNATGTFYVMGDSRDGPYRIPSDCLLLGSGRGRFDNYVGRTIPFGDTRLLYHHTVGGAVTWGAPKLVRQNDDGTLWLGYWPGLEGLETRVLLDGAEDVSADDALGDGEWTVRGGSILGRAEDGSSVLWLPVSASDAMITCSVDIADCDRAGLLWRWDGDAGTALTLSRPTSTVAVLKASRGDEGFSDDLIDDVTGVRMKDGPQHVRVLARAHRVEVYVNDAWLFGISLPDAPSSGRIGLLVDRGRAAFDRLRIAEVEPL